MKCPVCGFVMDDFTVDCPRCQRMEERTRATITAEEQAKRLAESGVITTAPPPVATQPPPVEVMTIPPRVTQQDIRRHPMYWTFSFVGLLLPLVGFIIGIIKVCSADETNQQLGKSTLLWSLAGAIIGTMLYTFVYIMTDGFLPAV